MYIRAPKPTHRPQLHNGPPAYFQIKIDQSLHRKFVEGDSTHDRQLYIRRVVLPIDDENNCTTLISIDIPFQKVQLWLKKIDPIE